MTKDEALDLALEALESERPYLGPMPSKTVKAITAIKQALAAPVQEPVAWMYQCTADNSKPVLWRHRTDWAESGTGLWIETPLYTTPPAAQRPWVGLTDEERMEIYNKPLTIASCMDEVEAKLRSKNHDQM